MSSFALFLLCFCCGVFSSSAFETYESVDIEKFHDLEVKRIPKAMYLTHHVNSPSTTMSDFQFMTVYSYEELSRYYDGDNFDGRVVPHTTPMFLKLDVLDMSAPQTVSTLIPKDLRHNPPAPMFPLHLQLVEEKYYFIKKINETELWPILHAAAKMLVDLSYQRMPFDDSVVHIALYNFPPNSDNRETEIWVERSLRNEGYLVA